MSIKIHSNKITIVMALAAIMVFSISSLITATSKDDIVYPIADLGGCESEVECRAYCEQRDNADILRSCLDFAKEHKLLPAEVIAHGQKFIEVAINGGPGDCRDEKSCVNYCDNPAHMQECLDFAINNDLIPDGELQESRKILGALRSGLTTPGSCTNRDECISYCENPAHIDECLAFAEKSGMMSLEDIEQAKRALPFIKSGETPGGCTSRASCDSYCSDDTHFEECISFAEKAGFASSREAEFARKFRGKSPGDCASGASSVIEAKRACTEFCNNPENQPVCFSFAEEAGFMTRDQASQMGSLSDFQSCIPEATPEIQECFIDGMGPEMFDAMRQGVLPLDGDMQAMMQKIAESRACVNKHASQSVQAFSNDPNVISCINAKLGADYLERARRGEVKCGEAAAVRERIESCMGAINEDRNREIIACLEKDCTGMMACLSGFQSASAGQDGGGIANLPSDLQQRLDSRLAECTSLRSEEQQGIEIQQRTLEEQKRIEMERYLLEQGATTQQIEASQQTTQSSGTLPDYCSNFTSLLNCSYAGPVDSDNYKYCKECYPDK